MVDYTFRQCAVLESDKGKRAIYKQGDVVCYNGTERLRINQFIRYVKPDNSGVTYLVAGPVLGLQNVIRLAREDEIDV